MTDIRATRKAVEVLTNLTTTPIFRTTRIATEVLASLATGAGGPENTRQLWVNLL